MHKIVITASMMLMSHPNVQADGAFCGEAFNKLGAAKTPVVRDISFDKTEVQALNTQAVDKSVLGNLRKGDRYFYVVDDHDNVYAVHDPLPYKTNNVRLAVMRTNKGDKALVPIKDSGEIVFNPKDKSFLFRSDYPMDLSAEEREAMIKSAKAAHPDVAMSREDLPGTSLSTVKNCASILTDGLAGKGYQMGRLYTRASLFTGYTAFRAGDTWFRKDRNNHEKAVADETRLATVVSVDILRVAGFTAAGGAIGKYLTLNDVNKGLQYFPRLATGFTINYATKIGIDNVVQPLEKKVLKSEAQKGAALSPADTSKLMLYNNAQGVVYPAIQEGFDHAGLVVAPLNIYETCLTGGKANVFVSPRYIRIYEGAVATMFGLPKYIWWGA